MAVRIKRTKFHQDVGELTAASGSTSFAKLSPNIAKVARNWKLPSDWPRALHFRMVPTIQMLRPCCHSKILCYAVSCPSDYWLKFPSIGLQFPSPGVSGTVTGAGSAKPGVGYVACRSNTSFGTAKRAWNSPVDWESRVVRADVIASG